MGVDFLFLNYIFSWFSWFMPVVVLVLGLSYFSKTLRSKAHLIILGWAVISAIMVFLSVSVVVTKIEEKPIVATPRPTSEVKNSAPNVKTFEEREDLNNKLYNNNK